MPEENISAIATPPGKGGVAIIRLSGGSPLSIAEKMFVPAGTVAVKDFEPYRLYPGRIDGGTFTDYGLCVYFKAPASYTGEDVVEFQCHGGESVARGILRQTFRLGRAERGTGRIYQTRVSQRQAFLSVGRGDCRHDQRRVRSRSKGGVSFIQRKTYGKGTPVAGAAERSSRGDRCLDRLSRGGSRGIGDGRNTYRTKKRSRRSHRFACGYAKGKKIKSGVTVALCGKPNTGKSSLLNRLLGYEKAIVSDVAGTTRDAVEGILEIEGTKFNLYDTAGVRESGDRIESIGIEKAENIVRAADVVVFVADSAAGTDAEDARVLELARDKPLVKVVNKIDLTDDETPTDADVLTSAVTGEGIERLKALLYEKSFGDRGEDAAFLIEERHYAALEKAKEHLKKAVAACGGPLELVGIDVTEAWERLGEITGETASEAIIEEIFSKFCVGK